MYACSHFRQRLQGYFMRCEYTFLTEMIMIGGTNKGSVIVG